MKRIRTIGIRAVEGDIEAIEHERAVLRHNGIFKPKHSMKPRYEPFVEYEDEESEDEQ